MTAQTGRTRERFSYLSVAAGISAAHARGVARPGLLAGAGAAMRMRGRDGGGDGEVGEALPRPPCLRRRPALPGALCWARLRARAPAAPCVSHGVEPDAWSPHRARA